MRETITGREIYDNRKKAPRVGEGYPRSIRRVLEACDSDHLAHPAMPAFLEKIGLADYWRVHGEPDCGRPIREANQDAKAA